MSHPVLTHGMYGIMSGDNPQARPTVPGGHHALIGAVNNLHLPFEEVQGHYGQPERSLLIHNVSEAQLKQLGKDFGQESVIHSVGGNHRLHYVNGPRAGHYQEGRGMEMFSKPPEDFYTELPGHGYFRLHFQQKAAHPHSYDWHDGHTGYHQTEPLDKAEHNEQHAPAGSSSAYMDIARHFGTVGQEPSNLKHYRYEGKSPDVNNLVRSHGYQTYYAGGRHGKPDLANKNYNTNHLMIYDPQAGSGGDFGETEYTDNWRKVHELGHALTLNELNAKYGEAPRMGKLGVHRTPHEAMRAVHWEWLAAHKQRELNKQLGVHVSDPDFHRELNTVMHDAVHRAVTGKFADPGQEKFVPHPHMVPLSSSLALVAGAAQKMGLHPHETVKKKAIATPPVANEAPNPVTKSETPETLIPRIKQHLTDDIRKNPWKGHENPMAGHCYVASEALYHKLGGQRSGWVPQFVVHEGAPHWFLKHRETGQIVDPTASQFSTPVPYNLAKGKGFLTKEPSARAAKVLAGLSKAEAPNLVPVRGQASMADAKTEKSYTPEEVAQILMKATREKIASYAVEIENLRKREAGAVAKSIIPVHAHNQGTQAGSGTEDVPAAVQAGKTEKGEKETSEWLDARQKGADARRVREGKKPAMDKAEKCMKCGEMHQPMEKCGDIKLGKDQPSPEYKDSSGPVDGTPNAGEKELAHDKLEPENMGKSVHFCKSSSCSKELLGKNEEFCAKHERGSIMAQPMKKAILATQPDFGAFLGKNSKCMAPGCKNPKTGSKYCSRACSLAVEDPKGLKAAQDYQAGKTKEHPLAEKAEALSKPPVSQKQRELVHARADEGVKWAKEWAAKDPGGKLPEYKKSEAPPGVSTFVMQKLQATLGLKKALAAAWRIHDELAKNSTNQFFNNGADAIADAGTAGKSPANDMATSASNQVGHQAGGAGDNMPVGEGNVLNKGDENGWHVKGKHTTVSWHKTRGDAEAEAKRLNMRGGTHHTVIPARDMKKGEQFVDNQGHVVETGIEPTATLPPQAPAKARSRGVVPQRKEKNGQILRNGEDNGSGGIVLPGASLRRPGRTAGKRGADVSADRGMLDLGGITEPSQEGFGDSGPSGNDKTYSKRGEGKTAAGAVDKGPSSPASKLGTGEPVTVPDSKVGNDKTYQPVKKSGQASFQEIRPGSDKTKPTKESVKKAAAAGVPTAKPAGGMKAPGSASTGMPKAPKMPKMPTGPAAGGVGPGLGAGMGGGASGGKSEPGQVKVKPSAETQAWMKQPATPKPSTKSPMATALSGVVKADPAAATGAAKVAAVSKQPIQGMSAPAVKLPGSHLLPANPAPAKNTAPAGPLKVAAPKAKPGIFGKLGRRSQ